MFDIRKFSLLLLCTDILVLKSTGIYPPRSKRELPGRNDLPQKANKMASSVNDADSPSNNNRNSKKANNKLSREYISAYLTRSKRSDDNNEGNVAEEPYFRCTNNKCQNGGICFQRGSKFWCSCGSEFAGKWCEMKRVPSVEDANCNKSKEYQLTFALAAVVLLFLFCTSFVIYWYRRRMLPWKNEKEEWNQLLKDRQEDGGQTKMPGPPLPPRRYLYSEKDSHNGGSPEYISLTDIRKYVDDKDDNDQKSPKNSTRKDSKRTKSVKSPKESTPQSVEKKQDEPRPDKNNNGNSADEVKLSGGYHHKSPHTQLEMKPKASEILHMDSYPENVANNSERIRREIAWQKSLKALALNKRVSNGKTREENQPLFSKSPCEPTEPLSDKEGNSTEQ